MNLKKVIMAVAVLLCAVCSFANEVTIEKGEHGRKKIMRFLPPIGRQELLIFHKGDTTTGEIIISKGTIDKKDAVNEAGRILAPIITILSKEALELYY
jgi:hypothetical protein